MKLYELLADVNYTCVTQGNPDIDDIIYDSRKVKENTAFVCLKGYTSDGHKFAASAVEKGAAALKCLKTLLLSRLKIHVMPLHL